MAADSSPQPQQRVAISLTFEGEAAAAESATRMALILAFVKAPGSRPEFADKARMFKLVTDERTHQQLLAQQAREALAALPDHAEVSERAALEATAAAARRRQAMLFDLLKKLTGVHGHTGGTNFEAEFDL
jgi:hypothetical protein